MRNVIVACVITIAPLASPAAVHADVVTDWNAVAAQAIGVAGARQGPAGNIDVAMVQLAIHDAIQAFQHRFETYSLRIANATGSPVAAAATAARDVLVGVGLTTTPSGTVDSLYMAYLASHSLIGDPGIFVGQQAATNILNLRAFNDGRPPSNAEQFFGGTAPGDWRPTSLIPGTTNPMRFWAFWRPLTAIRLGDSDGNSKTSGDPAWQSLIATPNYPDYTSGANNLSGAVTTMLANFFGTDTFTFSITSVVAGLTQNPRTYAHFSDAADDVVDARVFEGSTSGLPTGWRADRGRTSPTGRLPASCDR
jgi:hypothetical protein